MNVSIPEDARYKPQPGALDIVSQRFNANSEAQLAALIGTTPDGLDRLRHGYSMGAAQALHISQLMGCAHDLWAGLRYVTDDEHIADLSA